MKTIKTITSVLYKLLFVSYITFSTGAISQWATPPISEDIFPIGPFEIYTLGSPWLDPQGGIIDPDRFQERSEEIGFNALYFIGDHGGSQLKNWQQNIGKRLPKGVHIYYGADGSLLEKYVGNRFDICDPINTTDCNGADNQKVKVPKIPGSEVRHFLVSKYTKDIYESNNDPENQYQIFDIDGDLFRNQTTIDVNNSGHWNRLPNNINSGVVNSEFKIFATDYSTSGTDKITLELKEFKSLFRYGGSTVGTFTDKAYVDFIFRLPSTEIEGMDLT